MAKIYQDGLKYKHEETKSLQVNYLLNLNTNDSVNPDAKIPFLNLRNVFLRPNIDEGLCKSKNIFLKIIVNRFIQGDPYDDVNHEEGVDENLYVKTLNVILR